MNTTLQTRSRIMASVRSKNTTPEMMVRKALHSRKLRFNLHVSKLLGHPDLVLPRHHVIVFVNGCFWHLHGCRNSVYPHTNPRFWKAKLLRNRDRDLTVIKSLRIDGWRIAVIWECAFRGEKMRARFEKTMDILASWIRDPDGTPFLDASDSKISTTKQLPRRRICSGTD